MARKKERFSGLALPKPRQELTTAEQAVQALSVAGGTDVEASEPASKAKPKSETKAAPSPAKQRSRDGMVKVGIYMSKEARDELKLFVMQRKAKGDSDEGLEGSLLEAVNEWLVKRDATFVVS